MKISLPRLGGLLVSERTIYREIKRGKVELLNSDLTKRLEYVSDVAMRIYEEKQSKKDGYLKIGKNHELAILLYILQLLQFYR